MRQISQCPEREFLVTIVKWQHELFKRLSRTWFRHDHIEYSEMFRCPIFPRFRRYVPEEDLAIEEDTRGRDNQPISQLDPLIANTLDLDRRRGSPSENVLQSGRVPQRRAGVELPGGGTFEHIGEWRQHPGKRKVNGISRSSYCPALLEIQTRSWHWTMTTFVSPTVFYRSYCFCTRSVHLWVRDGLTRWIQRSPSSELGL